MGQNSASTNTKQLPTFSNTKPFEQLAIVLRAEGKDYEDVVNTVNAEYSLAYKQQSIRQWFMVGGRLEQAYLEYNEAMADQAVAEAKLRIKKLSLSAATTLEELMGNNHAGNVRQQAARTILGKYIPDRQILVDESKVEEIPEEIGSAGDAIMDGAGDGQKQVDNSPKGEPAAETAGPGGDETLPAGVLPEQPTTD